MFDHPVGVVCGSRGSLGSAHLSNFWAARSRSQYPVGCLLLTLWVNIHWYYRVQALVEVIPLHLLHMLLYYPSWTLQLEYLDLL